MTLWIGNSAMTIKIILKINNSWTELFNFQNSFNCHGLELITHSNTMTPFDAPGKQAI